MMNIELGLLVFEFIAIILAIHFEYIGWSEVP
jgi:hypothetical protein